MSYLNDKVRSFVEMADPLSMLTDDIEDEEIEIDTSSSTNDKSQNSSVSQKKTDDIDHDASHSSAEHEPGSKEFDREGNIDSPLSDNFDILAKIDEEMGSAPQDLAVTVDNPEKVVKTMESYIAFSVKTKTTRSDFEDPEYNVKRRYNDFLWLRQQIEEKNPALIIPPLPEKHNLTIDRFDKEFIKFRQVALDRFMKRLSLHPITSQDSTLKAFLTLDDSEFQVFKKQGAGLFSRVTKSLSTKGGSLMLKNRAEEYSKMYEYAQSFGQKMAVFERIALRVSSEQNDYLQALAGYVPAYEEWAAKETELAGNLSAMAKLMSSLHDNLKSMVDETSLKIILPTKEYFLFTDSIKAALTSRDALQHELEVITEELVKCREEKQQMEDGTESKGFLSRSNTEEATQAKADKLSGRISELENAHAQCKTKLEERNLELKTDMERWHLGKKADIKEWLCGMADRHIDTYDKQIASLENTLEVLKNSISSK
ncbi:SNX7 [Bugula neritina]|uniref:SNX7 n=1 Tax=Bugula neritina TaxID=10212 RepID=A0A7J7IYQ0_BUGNE|nr:SNX7 [Bugula neritina]